MKTKKIHLIAPALAAALSAGAADFSIEGQLFLSDALQTSVEKTCKVSFYGAENASSPLYETNGVRLVTDASGYFVLGASAPDSVELPDTFWAGVKPDGHEELQPRFRVAPVPFAFAADEAQLISTEEEFELAGVATIDRLDVSGDVETEDLDKFSAEKQASVEAKIESSGAFYTHDHSKDRSADCSYTFNGDGFLLIAIKADSKQCPASRLSVKIGGTTIYDRAVGIDRGGVVKRFMSVPYRSGEGIELNLTATGGGEIPFRQQEDYTSNIGVKLQLVRFGRK